MIVVRPDAYGLDALGEVASVLVQRLHLDDVTSVVRELDGKKKGSSAADCHDVTVERDGLLIVCDTVENLAILITGRGIEKLGMYVRERSAIVYHDASTVLCKQILMTR